MDALDIGVLAGTALFSTMLGSVAGTGGTTVLLPVLVHYFGIQAAVPMVTLANLAANVSRAVVHGREVDRPVVGWFTLGSLPLTVLGAWAVHGGSAGSADPAARGVPACGRGLAPAAADSPETTLAGVVPTTPLPFQGITHGRTARAPRKPRRRPALVGSAPPARRRTVRHR
jgi:hypothetical protein